MCDMKTSETRQISTKCEVLVGPAEISILLDLCFVTKLIIKRRGSGHIFPGLT